MELDADVRRSYISIHPPREGWDEGKPGYAAFKWRFQSTHPARGGTGLIFAATVLE